MFKKKKLSLEKMRELEDWLAKSELARFNAHTTTEDLCRAFSLKIEYVAAEELPQDTEAVLMPYTEENYVGLIKLPEKFRNISFGCIHEIVHYLKDVGNGKHVTKTFTRKTTGKTENSHEQEINYITAAYIMPLSEIQARLKKYDKSSPKEDELLLIQELQKKYGQNRSAIIRRIQEARKLHN